MPTISVIIPVFNASQYLKECIDSIVSQSFKNYELLLIDDGCQDESGNICDEYAKIDERIKVFHQINSGVSVARNVGLDNAQGEWIVFADADDIMLPNALSILYNAVYEKNADVVLGSTKVLVKDRTYPYHVYDLKQTTDVINNMNHPALWGYLFKASLIHDKNIRFVPKLAYSEDQVFLATIAIHAVSIITISDYVYIYRRYETSVSANKDGVKTSYHQFLAAFSIKKLINGSLSKEKIQYLLKKQKILMKGGYMDFASSSFSYKKYKLYEQQYLKFFEGKFLLFLNTLFSWLTYKRRKIISIKGNPLKGKRGLSKFIGH